jgi:hypothetical protein
MGVTNNFNIPYPEVTDFVTDGAVAMENIAEFADSALLTSFISPVLINGGMEIWQRGTTSQTSTTTYNTSTSYRADRWFVLPAGASVTQQQSTTVPPNNLSRFSLRVTGATSATTVKIGQRIETANIPQIRRRVTFAAWIYNETGASFQPELLLGTPSAADNFTTVNNRLTQTLIPCANNEWTEISFTVDISGYTDLANGLQVEIQIPSGSLNANTKFVYVTQVRLTPSENVVPFQRLGFDVELRRCQRYYARLVVGANGSAFHGVGSGFCTTTSNARIIVKYPQTMRSAPSLNFSNLRTMVNVVATQCSAISDSQLGESSGYVSFTQTTSGLTAGQGCVIGGDGATGSFFDMNSEL